MLLDSDLIRRAIRKAAKGHSSKAEVRDMLSGIDEYAIRVASAIESGTYISMLSYREFDTTNSNGKRRHIEQPSLFTRVLQHLSIVLLKPLYDSLDPRISYNCKDGYGISASNPSMSLSRFLKRNVYSRPDLRYALAIDQRHCYDHMTRKLYRRALKLLTGDSELIDFAVNVTFHGNSFPIGTPTSPFAHHVIMLSFDRWLGSVPGPKARYADDVIVFCHTKEEANAAKWRIANFWWYTYCLRAKRNPRIVDLDREPLSFCGLVIRRTPGGHSLGYCRPRSNIRLRAMRCRSDASYAAYFGIFSHTDSFSFLAKLEADMKFSELTGRIKIVRAFDAQPISLAELARVKFNIYDFELKYDKEGKANWLRMIVGVPETGADGIPTGNYLRYCIRTEAKAMVDYMAEVKKACDTGEAKLPFDDVELENSCGYMFKGTTDREMYCTRDNISLPNSSARK